MREMIAFCGLDCQKCEARIATINNDDVLRQIVADKWSKLNGINITKDMINCTGCKAKGVKTPFCENMCEIKKCATSKKLQTCASCNKMNECKSLSEIICNSEDALLNLKKGDTEL